MKFQYYLSLYIALCLASCAGPGDMNPENSFNGDVKAVELANQMYSAIGGKKAWCELRSLYIKAIHTEPQMHIPYTSEIWRGIDEFNLVIEQQNDSFHVKGVINENEGIIRYYDKRDTMRTLTPEQLVEWKYDNEHNIYVILHRMACHPQNYSVHVDENNRLAFYSDSTLVTSLGLDDQMRPYLFYSPRPDGSISGSVFTKWATDQGLVHSAGGHPLDSNFVYTTEIWQPGSKSLEDSFGPEIFNINKPKTPN